MAGDEADGVILKILSGVQTGVDVALLDGEYMIGAGDEDDIQLFDVSLKPGHARLTVRAGKMEIAGAAGQLRTRNGLVLEAGGTAQEIEPLDIVTAGTSRFAMGSRSANWATITQADTAPEAAESRKRPARQRAAWQGVRWRSWQAGIPVAAVLALTAAGFAAVPYFTDMGKSRSGMIEQPDRDIVLSAVNAYDFGRKLEIRQEVDGTVYVTGFVETPVERRAILSAIRETGVPARVRVSVLELMRNEVANLIESENVGLDFDISDKGKLTLTGVILDARRAKQFTDLVNEQIVGLSSLDARIRTAPTLLADAKALADRSQINPLVQLRLEDTKLIEASGVLPSDKIDSWVGFLQAYSSQFADILPLRSIVQLQNPDGSMAPAPDSGFFLGEGHTRDGDIAFDINRLRSGNFDLSDVFVGQQPGQQAPAEAARGGRDGSSGRMAGPASNAAAGPTERVDIGDFLARLKDDPAGGTSVARPASGTSVAGTSMAGAVRTAGGASAVQTAGGTGDVHKTGGAGDIDAGRAGDVSTAGSERNAAGQRIVGPAGVWTPSVEASGPDATADGNAAADPGAMALRLLDLWKRGEIDDDEAGSLFKQGMDALEASQAAGAGTVAADYAPMLARVDAFPEAASRCWRDSHLTGRTALGALFWLDLLSVSAKLSIVQLDEALQRLVLEAALNPEWTARCAGEAAGKPVRSIYLSEVGRNATFVRHITRDLSLFEIDVAGASIAGERYIQTRTGRKMWEGAAPDADSRLVIVGELGVAVERNDGLSAVIFDSNLNWLTR